MKWTPEELDAVKQHLPEYMAEHHGWKKGKNIRCINPDHQDDNPSMGLNLKGEVPRLKCFSCGESYSLIDVIMIDHDLDLNGAIQKAFELYGKAEKPERKEMERPETDFTKEAATAHENMRKEADGNDGAVLDYLISRGLEPEIINRYRIGEVPVYNDMLKRYPSLRAENTDEKFIIFPFMDEHGNVPYFLAEVAERREGKPRYRDIKYLEKPLFNERYLKGKNPEIVAICEGIYDALSLEGIGIPAIALCGTGQTRRLIELISNRRPASKFLILMDNDGTGYKAQNELAAFFSQNRIPYSIPNYLGLGNDPNAAMIRRKDDFKRIVLAYMERLKGKEYRAENYADQSPRRFLEGYYGYLGNQENRQAYPTGLSNLDELLDGGLYTGLYILGAVSSLGKTTFILQIADYIAETGRDVLFISLEMGKFEVISKSFSRNTFIQSLETAGDGRLAKTSRQIMTGNGFRFWTDEEKKNLENARQSYLGYCDNVAIIEGTNNFGLKNIREALQKHMAERQKKPVLIIDYLQIISPDDPRSSDKQNTDRAVKELKIISRDFDIPVIVISSLNRGGYEKVEMASFKESGAIEYSSDILIGLEYMAGQEENRQLIERGIGIPIKCRILKNRNGQKGDINFTFFPKFNYFMPRKEEKRGLSNGKRR